MPPLATFLAFASLAIWSFLAYSGAQLTHVPPFLVLGVALCISGVLSLPGARSWRVPLKTLAVGLAGIFGYHFLYFAAFHYAPAVEVNLVNYLWPLLIVALSPLFLPGFRLKPQHVIGSLLGLLGAALIVTGGRLQPDLSRLPGYLLAAAAGLTWASYSLATKRLPPFPTAAVGAFCLLSGLLSFGVYFLTGGTLAEIAGLGGRDWLILLLVGLGPMGAAFFTWDAALKLGDPRIIGALAYLTPMTSTLVLVALGAGRLTWVSAAAMGLIILGAVVGSLDLFRKRI